MKVFEVSYRDGEQTIYVLARNDIEALEKAITGEILYPTRFDSSSLWADMFTVKGAVDPEEVREMLRQDILDIKERFEKLDKITGETVKC